MTLGVSSEAGPQGVFGHRQRGVMEWRKKEQRKVDHGAQSLAWRHSRAPRIKKGKASLNG